MKEKLIRDTKLNKITKNFYTKHKNNVTQSDNTSVFKKHLYLLAETNPALLTLLSFLVIIITSTFLLLLPISTVNGTSPKFVDALFTATSAVCVTGLTTVDTVTHWSFFGQLVIMISIKLGGLGLMTFAGIATLFISRKIGLTQKIVISSQNQTDKIGTVKTIIKSAIIISSICETTLFFVLSTNFYLNHSQSFIQSIWHGLFMSISIFNNAGFINLVEGIEYFNTDVFMMIPLILGTISGGLGFAVITNVSRNLKNPKHWDLHTKLTITTYFSLTIIGTIIIALSEWHNTLSNFNVGYKILNSALLSTTTRTCGLSTLNIGEMGSSSLFAQDILMFIGGGSASTAGGIKVTTLAVLILAIISEVRGDKDVEAFGKRIPNTLVRMSIAVLLISLFLVGFTTFILLSVTDFSLDVLLYETTSAFATVGLSTGITPDMPTVGKYLLIILMFTGRIGTLTITTALAMRSHKKIPRKPVEKLSVG